MNIKNLILISIFSALTAIGAFINIPTPGVPFSLQFFFCAYAGIFLGSKRALLSQLIYIAVGLSGIPIFTKGGGIAYIFQPTFGFIIGFAACAYVIGLITERVKQVNTITLLTAVLAGLSAMYLIGLPYLYFLYNAAAGPAGRITFAAAVKLGLTPFIIFDLIKSLIVSLTGVKILSIIKREKLID